MKSFFLQNLPLKLLSLFLALILFVLVREDRDKQFEMEIPVGIQHTPNHLVYMGGVPKSIRVGLRGRWSKILQALENRNKPYIVSLRRASDGDLITFDKQRVQALIAPHGPAVVSLSPASVHVRLENRITKRVPVRPQLVGKPARGYVLGAAELIHVLPDTVTITGPASAVQKITAIETEPITIRNLQHNAVRDAVALRKPTAPRVALQTEKVRVEVPIEAVTDTAFLTAAPIEIRGCRPLRSCWVQPSKVPVQLVGEQLHLERIESEGGAGLLWLDASSASEHSGEYTDLPIRTTSRSGVVVKFLPKTPTVATLTVVELTPAPVSPPPVVRDIVPLDAGPTAPDAESTQDTNSAVEDSASDAREDDGDGG